jgi:hypothetical protein
LENENILRFRSRVAEIISVCGGEFRASRFTGVEREDILEIFSESEMTSAAFADAIGISANQFRNFQATAKKKPKSKLIPVKVTLPRPREFSCEVISPGGYRVMLPSVGVAAELLRDIEGQR